MRVEDGGVGNFGFRGYWEFGFRKNWDFGCRVSIWGLGILGLRIKECWESFGFRDIGIQDLGMLGLRV